MKITCASQTEGVGPLCVAMVTGKPIPNNQFYRSEKREIIPEKERERERGGNRPFIHKLYLTGHHPPRPILL